MEEFKIDLYERDYPNKQFPVVKAIGSEDALKIREVLAGRLGHITHDGKELLFLLSDKSRLITALKATDTEFTFEKVFGYINIRPCERIYINWLHYEEIDAINLDDFLHAFEYIWYPGVDDIDIFDDTLEWIISINPEGYISYNTF